MVLSNWTITEGLMIVNIIINIIILIVSAIRVFNDRQFHKNLDSVLRDIDLNTSAR